MPAVPDPAFAPVTAERIARNDAIFREANERIRVAADRIGFGGAIPFVCECAEPSCHEIVRVPPDDYAEIRSNPRWFLNLSGHQTAARGWAAVIADRGEYVVVEKLGKAGAVAEGLAEGTIGPEVDGGG